MLYWWLFSLKEVTMIYMVLQFLKRRFFPKKSTWVERHFVLVLVVSVAFAMTICLLIGLKQSVWFDEAYSIMLAKQPVAELLRLTSIDTHPPFYYLLLKAWASIFGWSELALRSLSILAFGGTLFLAGLLVRRLFSVRVALMTIPFLIVTPFMLRYGFEIRMYAIAALIGITATYVLVVALQAKNSRSQWIWYSAYAALVAAGMYVLYYLALLWCAHVIWLVWKMIKERQSPLLLRWPLAYAGSVFLFLPWLPTFLVQLDNDALSPAVGTLTLEQLMGIVTFNFMYMPVWQPGIIGSLVAIYVIVAVVYFAIKGFKNASVLQRQYLVLFGLYVAIPVLLLMLLSLRKPMYVERYLAHLIIGGMLFIGVSVALTLAKRSSKRQWMAAGVLIAIMAGGSIHLAQIGNYNFQRSQVPSIKSAGIVLQDVCDNRSAVVAKDPYVAIELSYYLPKCQIYFYSETAELSGGYAPLSNSPLRIAEPSDLIGVSARVYYVYDDKPGLTFPASFHVIAEHSFDNLHVQEFSVE
jgi:mannosyltransferase